MLRGQGWLCRLALNRAALGLDWGAQYGADRCDHPLYSGDPMSPFPTAVGLTLPLDWRARQEQGELPNVSSDVYAYLVGLGFDYCEFRIGGSGEALRLLRREAEACQDAGLGIALHPDAEGEVSRRAGWFGERPGAHRGIEPILRAGITAAEVTARPINAVVHPAQFVFDSPPPKDGAEFRAELVRRCRLFFAELDDRASELPGPAVRVLVEHQLPTKPGENVVRIGDTCAELLDVVADCGLGLCWDTGHFILSIDRHGVPEQPPDEFVRRVRHVHLHDVVAGEDHYPISSRSHRLMRYLQMLREVGSDVAITLEYALRGMMAAGGFKRVLPESMAVLHDWVA